MNEDIKAIGEKIPFVMLLATVFFRGITFIILDAPLLVLVLQDTHFSSLNKLLYDGVLNLWISATNIQSSLTSVFFLLLLSLMIGFATTPIQQIFAGIITFFLEFRKILKMRKDSRVKLSLFSPFQYADKDYIKVMEWLSYNPQAKAQWEWQQFFYHMWWSFAMGFIVFSTLSFGLIDIPLRTQAMSVLIPVTIVFTLGAIYHSWHMGNVHRQSIKRMKSDKKFEDTFSSAD